MKKWVFLALGFLTCGTAFSKGEEHQFESFEQAPWLTGPLLAPSGHTIPKGHINLEPYVFATKIYGVYDDDWHAHRIPNKIWSISPQLSIQVGLTDRIDLSTTPQAVYNYAENLGSAIRFGDLPFGFDFQLRKGSNSGFSPAIKFTVIEVFPTGKFQNLDPHKGGIDAGGTGSFATRVGLTFSQLFNFDCNRHFLATRLNFDYTFHAPVHVHGFNFYGGGFETHGKVLPGNSFTVILGLEYTLTQNWVLALDILNQYNQKTTFRGNHGHTIIGTPAVVSSPSNDQLSLAPAIEYNWSADLGLIAGVWFTVAGRNSAEFASGVVAFNYYH